MTAPAPGQPTALFARWYHLAADSTGGVPADEDAIAESWRFLSGAEREFWRSLDSAQEPEPDCGCQCHGDTKSGIHGTCCDPEPEPVPGPPLHRLSGLIAGWRSTARELEEGDFSDDPGNRAEAQTLREVIRQVLPVVQDAAPAADAAVRERYRLPS
jgi:hypothetical protein